MDTGLALGVFIGTICGIHFIGYTGRLVIVMVYSAFDPLFRERL
jgi:hypothetical protein